MCAAIVQSFSIVDLIIVILLLTFGIFGLVKGFIKQAVGLISTICAFVVAYLFCATLANFLFDSTPIGTTVIKWIKGLFDESWNVEINVSQIEIFLEEKNLPAFFIDAVINVANALGFESVNVAEVAGNAIAKYLLIGLSYTAIFLLAKLIFMLIEKLLAFVVNHTPIKILDKILGFVLGALKASIIVWVVIFIIDLLSIEILKEAKTLIDSSIIASVFSKYNPFVWLVNLIFN